MFKNTKAKSSLRRSLNAMVNATVLKGQDKKYRGQEYKPKKHTRRNLVYRKKEKRASSLESPWTCHTTTIRTN